MDVPSVRGYITEQAWEGPRQYVLMVSPVATEPICIADHEVHQCKDGTEICSFHHAPYRGKSVMVNVIRQSYQCSECGATYCTPLIEIDDVRRMSRDLIQHIRSHPETPSAKMAREVGVSEGSVLHVLSDYACEIIARRNGRLPLLLGVDEIYLGSTMRCVITDLANNRHYRLLVDNTEHTLKSEFRSYNNRTGVVAIAIDMSFHYRQLLEELFPQAAIVIDLFHVISLADQCREAVRKAAVRSAPRSKRPVLRARRGFWEDVGRSENPIDGQMPLFGDDLITLAKQAHEDFCAIFRDAHNAREGAVLSDAWEGALPLELRRYYEPLIRALHTYRDEIFARLDFYLTNGFTEGHNARIRTLHRQMPSARIKTLDHHLIIRAELKRLAEERDDSRTPRGDKGCSAALDADGDNAEQFSASAIQSKVPPKTKSIGQPTDNTERSSA